MWDYFDDECESEVCEEYPPDQPEEREVHTVLNDSCNLIHACQYSCCWNNFWCSFDVTAPQLNWRTTGNSFGTAPDLPPGVTVKARPCRISSSKRILIQPLVT